MAPAAVEEPDLIRKTQAPVTIRPALRDDATALVERVGALAAHHGDTPSLTPTHLLRDAFGKRPWVHVLVAGHTHGLVGYAALFGVAQLQFGVRGMDLHHLFVRPHVRHAGLGRRVGL